jgi:hypothetical protein
VSVVGRIAVSYVSILRSIIAVAHSIAHRRAHTATDIALQPTAYTTMRHSPGHARTHSQRTVTYTLYSCTASVSRLCLCDCVS